MALSSLKTVWNYVTKKLGQIASNACDGGVQYLIRIAVVIFIVYLAARYVVVPVLSVVLLFVLALVILAAVLKYRKSKK